MTPSGREKLLTVVAVSFGLLCILQAALNVALRISLHRSCATTPDFEAIIKNLMEEGEDLKRKLGIFDHYSEQGWVFNNHSFYYISSVQKSWQESRDDCQQRGGDLIIINSKEEQEFAGRFKRFTWIGLTSVSARSKHFTLFGLTSRDTEGEWKWVDGTALNTSYWHTGEPNNLKDEDCVETNYGETSWNDASCEQKKYWICEKVVAL